MKKILMVNPQLCTGCRICELVCSLSRDGECNPLKSCIRVLKLAEEAKSALTISGGLASYPWDGVTSEQLYERADMMLLESKRQGKNVLSFGAGAMADKDLLDQAAELDGSAQ